MKATVCTVVHVEPPPSWGMIWGTFIVDIGGDAVWARPVGDIIRMWNDARVAGYCRTEHEAEAVATAKVVRPDLNDRDHAKFCVVLEGA